MTKTQPSAQPVPPPGRAEPGPSLTQDPTAGPSPGPSAGPRSAPTPSGAPRPIPAHHGLELQPEPRLPLPYDPQHNVGRALIDAAAMLATAADRRARDLGISGAQWAVLIRIGGGLATTAKDLSQSLGQDSGAMTRMVSRLEGLGLIERLPSGRDRRSLRLALTPKGEALYPKAAPIAMEVLETHLAGFSAEETRQLIAFLERMIANGHKS